MCSWNILTQRGVLVLVWVKTLKEKKLKQLQTCVNANYNCNVVVTVLIFGFLCLELLCDCAELCKCCRLTDCVYSQCESGDYGFSVQSTPQKWGEFCLVFFNVNCLKLVSGLMNQCTEVVVVCGNGFLNWDIHYPYLSSSLSSLLLSSWSLWFPLVIVVIITLSCFLWRN